MTGRQAHRAPAPSAWAPADPLGEALHFLHMDGIVYTRSELTAPWGLDLPAMQGCIMFHVVIDGQCWLEVDGQEPLLLQPGEFTLVPHGLGHVIADSIESPATPLFDIPCEKVSERYEILRLGGGGQPTLLMCGAVRFDHPAARELVNMLPQVIHIRGFSSPHADWMQSTLRLMAAEARERQPGGEAVLTRLADILVIQAIRSWITENPGAQTGWLGALHDGQIGPAILLMQREPGRAWTVAGLASEVAMSRSAFALRFRDLVGETPLEYLTRWRMHLATTWLREGSDTLAEMAGRLGYQSEAAFSRAFKRLMGTSPGALRKAGK